MAHDYSFSQYQNRLDKFLELKVKLPFITHPYLDEIELELQPATALAYEQDIYIFFQYLFSVIPRCLGIPIQEIDSDALNDLSSEDINAFQAYLSSGAKYHCSPSAIARKMSALRSFFKYAVSHHQLKNDPTIDAIKIRKSIRTKNIKMDNEEVQNLVRVIENSNVGSERSQKFSEKTHLRDEAIFMLLLGTGLRVSELVGLDLDDVDLIDDFLLVTRKNGERTGLYFNESISALLQDYIDNERPLYESEEPALFYSLRRKRMAVRSVQEMIDKYTSNVLDGKKVTAHSLRKTYGAALYQMTGDIQLVADVLGHKDINTTSRYYSNISDERRRKAAKYDPYER